MTWTLLRLTHKRTCKKEKKNLLNIVCNVKIFTISVKKNTLNAVIFAPGLVRKRGAIVWWNYDYYMCIISVKKCDSQFIFMHISFATHLHTFSTLHKKGLWCMMSLRWQNGGFHFKLHECLAPKILREIFWTFWFFFKHQPTYQKEGKILIYQRHSL